jgi:NinB protein
MSKITLPLRTDHDQRVIIDRINYLGSDQNLQVTIEKFVKKRTESQNKKLWSSVIGDYVKQGRMNGLNFDADTWHYYLKREFLPGEFQEGITLADYVKWSELPDGTLRLTGSTTKLTTKGKSEYLEKCYAFGASELDIRFTISPKEAEMLGWST